MKGYEYLLSGLGASCHGTGVWTMNCDNFSVLKTDIGKKSLIPTDKCTGYKRRPVDSVSVFNACVGYAAHDKFMPQIYMISEVKNNFRPCAEEQDPISFSHPIIFLKLNSPKFFFLKPEPFDFFCGFEQARHQVE
jgi:hypothetical protein